MACRQTSNPLVKTFQRLCHEHLKPQERERLVRSLKSFERSRDVIQLTETMVAILDTPEKSSALYPVVYELIPVSCRGSYQEILQRKLSREEDRQLQKNMHHVISDLQSQDNSVLTNPVDASNTINLQKVIHLDRSPNDGATLGFRLCDSYICGPGFFINRLEPVFAEWSGLEIGDELVAVNDISVHNWQMTADQLLNVMAEQRQQRAGVDIHIQRLMFSPQKLTTGGSCLIQDVCWYDVANMTFHRKHKPKWPSQLRHTRMKMKDSTTGRMGLNIRGGREFSCGIYISKVERGGLAERCGLRVGDQILTVNGVNLSDVPYRVACQHMAYEDTLDLVVRYMGQFPIYTEVPQNLLTDIKPKDRNFLHDTRLYRPKGKNYPYSNGRVDPVGSCSPGTIHSYKQSGSSNEDPRQKGFYTDTSYIHNPLCSDESSLLNSLPDTPSPVQTSVKAPEMIGKGEINHSNTPKVNWLEVPPKPSPRTGKPDLEKLSQLLSRRNEAAVKHHQPSRISQEDAGPQFSKAEVVTTAIVHQPAEDAPIVHQPAEDAPTPKTLEDGDFLKPVEPRKLKGKTPRKHKKNFKMNGWDEKSKPESKNKKEVITKPDLQTHPGLITEPTYITTVKIDAEAENIEPELVERLGNAKPEPVTETAYTSIPNIAAEPESVTETAYTSIPNIVAEPKSVTETAYTSIPNIVAEPESVTETAYTSIPNIVTEPESVTETAYTSIPNIVAEPESVTETVCTSIPNTVAEPESVTETAYTSIPNIVVETENITKPEIIVEPECNDSESFTEREPINKPVNFMKPVVTLEPEMFSIHHANSPTSDDDDRLSYISSMSLEYDGDNFIMKSPLSDDEAMSSNHSNSRANDSSEDIWPLISVISNSDAYKVFKLDEGPTQSNSVMSKVRQLEEKHSIRLKKANWGQAEARREVTEPVSLPPEKLSEPPEIVVPPSSIPSPQNTMERANYTKPKRRTEEGRFHNTVAYTMANLAASNVEDAENNPFQMLQKMASVILTKRETKSIMQYVAEYFERNDVEQLVSRLLEVLNNPEKHLLLNQIRELVSPFDRGRFDSMLSVHENINFHKPDYRERFSDKGERGSRPSLKEDQSLLSRVQCRRKQLDAQIELLEHLRKMKPKIYKHKEEDLNLITVYVSKNIRNLGISVSGGADCKKQQAIIIEDVHSGGAAAETRRIKPGMTLVSVDDEDIEAVNHKAAVYTIRKAFTDRKRTYMKLVLRKKPADVERWPTS